MKAVSCLVLSLAVHGFSLAVLSGTAQPVGEPATAVNVKIIMNEKPRAIKAQASTQKAKPKPEPIEPKVATVVKKAPAPKPQPVAPSAKASAPEPVEEPQATTSDPIANEEEYAAPAPQQTNEEVGGISGDDDSQAPELIGESFRHPRYTAAARRAGYETVVLARILVDIHGRATKVEFGSGILYEMDERIITALKRARFRPGKNRFGVVRESWMHLRFKLEIDPKN